MNTDSSSKKVPLWKKVLKGGLTVAVPMIALLAVGNYNVDQSIVGVIRSLFDAPDSESSTPKAQPLGNSDTISPDELKDRQAIVDAINDINNLQD